MTKFSALVIFLATVLQAMPSDTCNQNTWVTNGPVYAIAPAGDKVYIGGSFTQVGPYTGGVFDSIHSVIRNNIAALDATTGTATSWNPNANDQVIALAVSGTTVYAGGFFGSVGGQSRNRIAALDAATGNATAWNPNAKPGGSSCYVNSIAVTGTTVYAGGTFDTIGGQSRYFIAALDSTTGNATTWNPEAAGSSILYQPPVWSLAVSGTKVFAGGCFTNIGGQSRNSIAALDATTGNALTWNPDANGGVGSIAVSGSTVYVGGGFTSIGGQSRNYIAALDATTGNALAWNPKTFSYYTDIYRGYVNSIAVSGTTIFAGGIFDSIGGQNRKCIGALDATTGNAMAWNPSATYSGSQCVVYSLAVSGTTVYVGGNFNSIGRGVGHPYFARFDSVPGSSPVSRPFTSRSGLNATGLQIIGSNFRSGTFVKCAYALPKSAHVSLRLYSLNGQLQSELVNKHQDAGNYTLSLQRGNLAAGLYIVAFKAGDYHQEKMISLMK